MRSWDLVAGIATGAAATVIATTETGRRLRERLLTEADPEFRAALDDWEPLVREVARAVRLAAREIEESVQRAAQFVSEMAATEPGTAQDASSPGVEEVTALDAASTGPAAPAVIDTVGTQRAEP